MTVRRCVVLCVTLLMLQGYARAQSNDGKISLEDRLLMASQVYADISIYFAHWRAAPNLDLDREYKACLNSGQTVHVSRTAPFAWHGDGFTGDTVSRQGDVTIVRIPSFSKSTFEEEAVKAISAMGSSRALILDVRGNHGGSTTDSLLAALMDRPYRSWAEETPENVGMFQSWGAMGAHATLAWHGGVTAAQKPVYSGPVYVLVDGGCYSACENVVMALKDSRRATLEGERTAGSTGQQYIRDFANGMALGLSTRRASFPDGAPFEGVGIAPDVEVYTTVEDLRSGRDPVLQKALELIQSTNH
jgi:C-terminal processing protease CtpA/Prc